jgi:hypothetical protein
MPQLEDYEEDELAIAQQYDLLEPLKIGDRIRIVLAGAPLEQLTGALGTVEGAETCGVIPVLVDGFGSKFLQREQLDHVMDEPKTPKNDTSASMQTAETIETSLSAQRTRGTGWESRNDRPPWLSLRRGDRLGRFWDRTALSVPI